MIMKKFKYFKPFEFECATPKCSIDDMNLDLLNKLDDAREFAGVPFRINSAYRTVEWEKSHGRAGTSSHCLGKAVDIHCSDSRKRLLIVNALLSVGFQRIGIAKTFIHVDNDENKPNCIWLYD